MALIQSKGFQNYMSFFSLIFCYLYSENVTSFLTQSTYFFFFFPFCVPPHSLLNIGIIEERAEVRAAVVLVAEKEDEVDMDFSAAYYSLPPEAIVSACLMDRPVLSTQILKFKKERNIRLEHTQ